MERNIIFVIVYFVQLHCYCVDDFIILIYVLFHMKKPSMPVVIKYKPINQIALTKTAK